jgi:gamma-glutamyltranspeptidase / glutathione hydrolase
VTVPGAVARWAELAERYGRRGLDACLAPAIEIAERGYGIGATAARLWSEAEHPPVQLGPVPWRGDVIRLPELAATLRRIAAGGTDLVDSRAASSVDHRIARRAGVSDDLRRTPAWDDR